MRRGETQKIPFFLSLAYSGWKSFSSVNTDFFIKAEDMVPVPSYKMLLFIKEEKWRETQRDGETANMSSPNSSYTKWKAGPTLVSAHVPCSSLLFRWRRPLSQPCWEHRPPACSPICFNPSEISLSDRLWFIWQKMVSEKLEATQLWSLWRWECSESGEEQQADLRSKRSQEETGLQPFHYGKTGYLLRWAFENLSPQRKWSLHRILNSNWSMYSAVTNWQQETPNAKFAWDRKGFIILCKQTQSCSCS